MVVLGGLKPLLGLSSSGSGEAGALEDDRSMSGIHWLLCSWCHAAF